MCGWSATCWTAYRTAALSDAVKQAKRLNVSFKDDN